METLYPAIGLLIGAAAAAFMTFRLMRSRLKEAVATETRRWESELAHHRQAVAEREQLLGELRAEVGELRSSQVRLMEDKARFAEQAAQAQTLRRDLVRVQEARETENRQWNGELAEAHARISTLRTRLEEQEKANAERLKQLEEAKAQMSAEFENLANRILEEKSRKFTDQNKTQLGELLKPMREQMDGFRKRVDDIHAAESKERGSLREQLDRLRELNQQINQEAVNLTRALKGDKKAQGNWGELILERVLEQSGLRKGVEYETQGAFRDSEGRQRRPDVIIHLPEGKHVVVDSKVSLLAYNEYVSAQDEQTRERALSEHVGAVHKHINELAGKHYGELKGLNSLDFVLLFMPIEPAFVAAFQADEQLFGKAFEQRIIVVTPTTLLATLRTIENIWRYERQNENAREIAERAGAVYDKLRGFVEDMEKLGNQLMTVHGTYEGAMNKLTRGRGNLISQSQKFVDLGVKVKKELPKAVLEQSDIDLDDQAGAAPAGGEDTEGEDNETEQAGLSAAGEEA